MDRKIPVLSLKTQEETKTVLQALKQSGYRSVEITLRTQYALSAIRYAIQTEPELTVGAGTVLNIEQCRSVLEEGVKFVVSPGLSREVALLCKEYGVPYYPGCVTPTEIMAALDLGITTVKFFPANAYGGIEALKALSAPFPQVRFIPTGGITRENLEDYLNLKNVFAVGGSFFVEEALRR